MEDMIRTDTINRKTDTVSCRAEKHSVKAVVLMMILILTLAASIMTVYAGKEKSDTAKEDKAEAEAEASLKLSGTEQADMIVKCSEAGYNIDFTDYGMTFATSGNVGSFGGKTTFCRDLGDFQFCTSGFDTYFITYDDVRKSFRQNKTIPPEFLKYLLKGLDNMEKELPGLDLTALNYNAKNVRFVKASEKDMGRDTVQARFVISDCTVLYNPDIIENMEFVIDHEMLGHGSMECSIPDGDEHYYYGFIKVIAEPDGDSVTVDTIGVSLTEAAANWIARTASGTSIRSSYDYADEELRLIKEICGMTTEEVLNSRGLDLYQAMYEHNIDDPVGFLKQSDNVIRDYRAKKFDKNNNNHKIREPIETLLIDAVDDNIAVPGALQTMKAMMDRTAFKKGIRLKSHETHKLIDSYDTEESFERIRKHFAGKAA